MKAVSYKKLLVVTSLPTPSAALEGVMVELSTDKKPYYCDGTAWVDLTAAGGGGGTPGGSPGQLQYNNAGAFAGVANVSVHGNDLLMAESPTPTTPTSGVKFFGKKIASRMLPAMVGPSGMDACMQPSIWRQKIGMLLPVGGATTLSTFCLANATVQGTATARAVATTNLFTRTRRVAYISAATAAAMAGLYYTTAQYTVGNGAGLGGFFMSWRFGVSDAAAVSGARMFAGLTSTTAAPTNVEPSGLLNSIGVAQLSTSSTQLYLVYGGSAAQAAIPLGTNFPPMAGVGATNGILYDFSLFSSPNSNGVIGYRLDRVGTAFSAEGLLTPAVVGTQTPASTTLLTPRIWRTNNATLLGVGLDIVQFYIETDY